MEFFSNIGCFVVLMMVAFGAWTLAEKMFGEDNVEALLAMLWFAGSAIWFGIQIYLSI